MACAFPRAVWNPKIRRGINAPCRKCMCCRLKKALDIQQFAEFYLYEAFRAGLGASFVCLTHNDDSLPLSLDTGLPSLSYSLFKGKVNAFQKECFKKFHHTFKYVASGEYGDEDRRPHYHIAALGLDQSEVAVLAEKIWPHDTFGIVDNGPLRPGGLRYVCKYLEKQVKGTSVEGVYDEMGIEMPFVVHSQNLDTSFITRILDDFTSTGDLSPFYGSSRPIGTYLKNKYNLHNSSFNLKIKDKLATEARNAHQSVNTYLREQALLKERVLVYETLAKGNAVDKTMFDSAKQPIRPDIKSLSYLASVDTDKMYRDIFDPIPF